MLSEPILALRSPRHLKDCYGILLLAHQCCYRRRALLLLLFIFFFKQQKSLFLLSQFTTIIQLQITAEITIYNGDTTTYITYTT